MKVLYIDHTSLISGAQRALLDLLESLPSTVSPTVMCPEGQLAAAVRALGVPVVVFPGTSGSLRLHPLRTPVAVAEIASSAAAVTRVVREVGADVIHANSLRAGLIVGAARVRTRIPTILHVHDALPATPTAAAVRRFLRASADEVITVSDYTTTNFIGNGSREHVHMLHNPLDLSRFDPALSTRRQAREALGIGQDATILGLVAQITPWKGQEVGIRALAGIHDAHPGARLLLVGEAKFVDRSTRYDNLSYLRGLHELAHELGLDENVEFWGERDDVPEIMRALDILLAPSWEEPFGRSIIEAMALGVPVVATDVGGPAEYIDHGHSGVLVPPRDVQSWSRALERLLGSEALRTEIGSRGSDTVRRRFDRSAYAARVAEVYDGAAQQGARDRHLGPTRPRVSGTGVRRVLHVEHQGEIGGAQISLLELMRCLSVTHEPALACPPGLLADRARQLGVPVFEIPASQITYKLHAVQSIRELIRFLRARRQLRGLVSTTHPDIVHANSLRAGLLASGIRRSRPPVVVHCRDLLPPNWAAAAVRGVVLRRATTIVAVSECVAARLAGSNWRQKHIVVVDNPVRSEVFDPARFSQTRARDEIGVAGSPVVGVLAQITPWKGQTRAVRILKQLREQLPNAQLLLAGEAKFTGPATRYDNRAYEQELRDLILELGLSDAVHLLGERDDPERILACLDVLLIPSTEEPFGRTAAEALTMEVPIVATNAGGPAEVLRDDRDGRVLPPDDIDAWVAAIVTLATQRPAGFSRSYAQERFSPRRHMEQMLTIYRAASV